jgi:hypothetical protein
MGKSRLLETLLVDAAAAGAVCHASTVLDFGAGRGRDAIHALVASLLAIPTGGPSGETRDGLDRALAEDRADDDDERALADLLLIPQRAGSFYEAMDSEARRLARTRAVRGVVELAAQRNVLVLAIEDAHWASQSVLDHALSIAQLGERLPVVLVMTTRRDGDPISDRWPSLVRLDLAPLGDDDAFALARASRSAKRFRSLSRPTNGDDARGACSATSLHAEMSSGSPRSVTRPSGSLRAKPLAARCTSSESTVSPARARSVSRAARLTASPVTV